MGSSFRENLREELDFQGISIKELSSQTGIPRRSIDNYLSPRESMPPADYACRIARVLNTSVEKLVGEQFSSKNDELIKENTRILALLNQVKTDDKKAIIQLLLSLSQH